ncbi:MAG: tandem-95 repeat protein [Thiothrix sp.]|nr:tandem-95 repeat protein [Thiothrix sp.]HPE61808.1 Ig-like domain-containing protein [Thiolinea sp.]
MSYPVSTFTQGRNGPTSGQSPVSSDLYSRRTSRGYRQAAASQNQNQNLPGLNGQQNNNLSALISLLQQLLQLLQGSNSSGSEANSSNNNNISNSGMDNNTGTTPVPTTPVPTAPGPITPIPTPSPPPAALTPPGPGSTMYDNAQTPVNTPVTIDALANDSATTADTRLTNFTQPQNGSLSIVDNKLVYTPNPNFQGHDNFSYLTSDGNRSNVGIQVGDVSQIPAPAPVHTGGGTGTANGDFTLTLTGTPVRIDVLANDFNANGDLQIQQFTQPQNGTVTQDGNTLVYTPNPGFLGFDDFTYDTGSGTGTVRVGVDAPHPNPDFATTTPGTPVSLDVLANDYAAGAEGITDFTQGQHGSVTRNGSQLLYTPDAGFEGTDTFSYQGAGSNTTLVQVSTGNAGLGPVPAPVPAPPNGIPTPVPLQHAVQDISATPLDTPVRIDVLRNDYSSANGSIQGFSQPANGSVTQDGNSFVYTPNAGFQGYDSFSYAREDGSKAQVHLLIGERTGTPGNPGPAPTVAPTPVQVNRPFS